jgi:hypothetical protein
MNARVPFGEKVAASRGSVCIGGVPSHVREATNRVPNGSQALAGETDIGFALSSAMVNQLHNAASGMRVLGRFRTKATQSGENRPNVIKKIEIRLARYYTGLPTVSMFKGHSGFSAASVWAWWRPT